MRRHRLEYVVGAVECGGSDGKNYGRKGLGSGYGEWLGIQGRNVSR